MSSILVRRANMVVAGSGPTPGRLPAGYTELAYLKGDGSAYINTGFKTQQVDKLVGKVAFETLGSSNQYIAGSRVTTASTSTAIGYAVYASSHGGFTYYPAAWPTNSVGVAITANQIISFETYIGTSSQSFTVDGVLKNSGTATISKGTSSMTLTLFGLHTDSNIQYAVAGTRIYAMTLYFNGSKIAEYVPAMRDQDSVVGMYDLVSDSFLTNAGSGTFSYGTL